MEMFPCQSSLITAYGYDQPKLAMDIQFNDGAVFRYFQVPRDVVVGFVRAKSKGHYFLEWIKGKYDYIPVFSTGVETDDTHAE